MQVMCRFGAERLIGYPNDGFWGASPAKNTWRGDLRKAEVQNTSWDK